jgi:2-dehydropantoate 2-reductase
MVFMSKIDSAKRLGSHPFKSNGMANMLRDNPTIAVLGAGAVGCYFGGMLARAGKAVTLIARANHVAAINMNGLYLDCLSFKEHVRLNATTDVADISNADLILCCVKSSDTEDAIRLIAPHIKKDAVILSLQNGVDNYERIRATISNPTFPSVVYVATRMAGDGHVEHVGRGELAIGAAGAPGDWADTLNAIAALFGASSVPCAVLPDVKRALWAKFLVNCAYNGISAIGAIDYGQMVETAEVKELIDALTAEFLLIAKKEGVNISAEEAMKVNAQIPMTMPRQKSSTAQDLMRGKQSEIDYLNGLIVHKGIEHNIPTPANQAIHALVKMLERKKFSTS